MEISLHQESINHLTFMLPGAIDNHYRQNKTRFDGRYPDIIDKDGGIHEIEIMKDKGRRYGKLDRHKTLWIVIPNYQVFDEIALLGQEKGAFIHLKKEQWIQKEIEALTARRNRLIKLMDEVKILESRTLYALPSFEFKEPRRDWCIICDKQSNIVISSKQLKMEYGLCFRHFERMTKAEV